MAKSPEEQIASMVANMKANTGKSMDEWVKIAKASKLEKHGEICTMLKKDHGLGHGFANLVAHTARGSLVKADGAAEDPSAGQYDGPKAALRPIYDKLVAAAESFGDDVELSPKKGYVSLRRAKQFACLHPSTATRFDLGLQLKGVEPKGRLELAGSWNGMVSHRVRIESVKEVDKELLGWLKKAYDAC
jgi:predicted transport protein